MRKAIFLAIAGLVLSLAAAAPARAADDSAKTDRCLVRPQVTNYDNYEYDNLSAFLGNFTIVEKAEEDLALDEKKFEIVNLRYQGIWIWDVECSFIPSEARITQNANNYSGKPGRAQIREEYEIRLASFWIDFNYFSPALNLENQEHKIWARFTTKIQAFVRIKTDNWDATLNDDQLRILVDSIKTQRPVRLKGKMYISFSANNIAELLSRLENDGIKFTVLEINGVPVSK